MSSQRPTHDRVLIDLNTQCDFLLPGGVMPVANRDVVLPRIREVMAWARQKQVPIISSLEARRAGEPSRGIPPACIDRSRGQRKVPFTLMPRRIVVMGDNTFDLPADPFGCYQQIIFTKRQPDFLSNPKADRLINSLNPRHWIVLGVATTHAVKSIVLGLLARSQRVVVVRDGCGYWTLSDSDHALRQMEAKGAIVVSGADIVSGRIDEIVAAQVAAQAAQNNGHDLDDDFAASHRVRDLRKARETESIAEPRRPHHEKPARPAATKRGRKPKDNDFVPPELIRRQSRSANPNGRGLA